MVLLGFTVALTLAISFICSLFEAMLLSTTTAEIEALKRSRPRRGEALEKLRSDLDDSIAAILILNTLANALGAILSGAIAAQKFDTKYFAFFIAGYVGALLIIGEIIPKNLGVALRHGLQPTLAYPLRFCCRALRPITWLCNLSLRGLIKEKHDAQSSDQEIMLLAERGAKEGTLSRSESSIIANALSLNDVRVSEIMTPRTVVTALKRNATVGEIFRDHPNIPFARIPVFGKNIDDVVGLIRRRDLLKAKANDQDFDLVEKLMQEIHFIPETVTVANALQVFLKTHQQMLVVVDEFGATAGVISMEDVMEHLLGREIFEKDDLAVDMRELARSKLQKQGKLRRPTDPLSPNKN